jgi:glucosamine--fructose-6-phosphate aminotransferase (isomerizing)
MCGIVGYIGRKPVYDILINGLKKLEYRGYDSSGVMIYDKEILVKKSKGKVSALEVFLLMKKIKKEQLELVIQDGQLTELLIK